jgi:hypothetical protein
LSALVTLTTDFGLDDHYVGVLHGVIAGIVPAADVVDLCHAVPPQDIGRAVHVLAAAQPYFPPDTVHVAIVDPGVGSARRAIAVSACGARWVAPDNGLLGQVFARLAAEGVGAGEARGRAWRLGGGACAVVLAERRYWLPQISRTFHGRDVFAPVAAHLAVGVALDALGPYTDEIALLPSPLPTPEGAGWRGAVLHADRFGNLVTNLRARHCPGPRWRVHIAGREIAGPSDSYTAMVGLGAILGSDGYLEIALPGGSAAAELGVGVGAEARIEPTAAGLDPAPP